MRVLPGSLLYKGREYQEILLMLSKTHMQVQARAVQATLKKGTP